MKKNDIPYSNYIIKKGNLKIYYPFRFEKYKAEDGARIIKDIQASELCISEEKYYEHVIDICLKNEFIDSILESDDISNLCLKMQSAEKVSDTEQEEVAVTIENANTYKADNWFIKMQQRVIEREVYKLNSGRDMYGLKGVSGKQLQLLIPAICTYDNGEYGFIDITCNIFFNGYGIIVADVPLKNASVLPFLELNYKKIYKKLYSLIKRENKFLLVDEGEKPVDVIINEYIEIIQALLKCEIKKYEEFYMLLLGEIWPTESMDQNITYTFKEFIYRFLCAQVPPTKIPSKELDRLLEQSKFALLTAQFYFSEVGRGISYSNLINKEKTEDRLKGMDAGIMLPIEVILLKKIVYQSVLEKILEFDTKKIEQIKIYFLSNDLFINGIRTQCRGTAHEMIDFMEKRLIHYLNKDIILSQYNDIEKILLMRRDNAREMLAVAVSYIGFLVTGVFSLPMIFDTVRLLRSIILIQDIPYITCQNMAVVIWGIILILSFFFFKKFYRGRKMRLHRVKFRLCDWEDEDKTGAEYKI